MAKNKILYIIIVVLVLIIIGGGLLFFLDANDAQEETQTPIKETQIPTTEEKMVDCGKAEDPFCFMGRANRCLPVTAKMIGSDDKTEIDLTILGKENETCHFQRKINNVLDLNCYFPKGTNIMNVIDQSFGNDRGLKKVIDDSCSGW